MHSGPPPDRHPPLGPLGRQVTTRPLAIIATAAVLAIVGAWLAAERLILDADTNHLIAADRPFMADFEAWLDEFGDLERLVVVVDPRDDEPAADAAVLDLLDRLAARDDLPEVHGRITDADQWRLAPRAMPEADLAALVEARDALELLAGEATTASILTAGVDRLRTLAGPDALRLDDAGRRRLGTEGLLLLGAIAGAADAVSPAPPAPDPVGLGVPRPDRWLANPDGRLRFIEILPRKDFASLAAIAGPLATIRAAVAEVAAAHPTVEIGLTGKPVLQADELATSDADMTRCAAGALAIIAVIFLRVFHGWRRPLLMVLAFAIAFGWSYGAATLLVGRLNLLSIVFMLVLVGVGLDYGVHVCTRWIEVRRRGGSIEETVAEVCRTAAAGNVFGAATSAGVFLLAQFTDFGGLRELGVVAGVGLLLCLVAMNVVLPAMLVVDERWRPTTPAASPETSPEISSETSSISEVSSLARPAVSTTVLALAAVITIVLGVVVATQARFQDNLLELQAEGLESVEWEHRVLADSASASWFAASIADTMSDAAAIVEAAAREPAIGSTRSVLDLVPIETPQRTRLLAALATVAPQSAETSDLPDADWSAAAATAERLATLARPLDPSAADELTAIASRLTILADAAAQDPAAVGRAADDARRHARETVTWMRDGAAADLRTALPPAVRDRLVAPSGRLLVSLIPAEDIWAPAPMARFVEAIRRVDSKVTGVPITQYESLRDMRRSFIEMAVGASVLVAVIVWLDFRRVRRTLAIMTVLGVGLLWTIGIATLLGVHLNVANFFAIPILIGLGVDSGIHLLHRLDESADGRSELGSTRRAIILTAVTTGIGFGSLVFARHRGLESLGVVMAVGSLCCLGATLVLLPALAAAQRNAS